MKQHCACFKSIPALVTYPVNFAGLPSQHPLYVQSLQYDLLYACIVCRQLSQIATVLAIIILFILLKTSLGSLTETHPVRHLTFFLLLIQFWTLTGHMWCILYARNVCSQLGEIVTVLAIIILLLLRINWLSIKPTRCII